MSIVKRVEEKRSEVGRAWRTCILDEFPGVTQGIRAHTLRVEPGESISTKQATGGGQRQAASLS